MKIGIFVSDTGGERTGVEELQRRAQWVAGRSRPRSAAYSRVTSRSFSLRSTSGCRSAA